MGFAEQQLIPLVDEGLGNSAYLVDLGDGRALAVDASRDLRALHTAARRRGLTVAYAADTHLHADFLSGVRQLAASGGAAVLAPATGRRAFDHTGLDDGDEVDLGGLTLRALGTPGHTDDHLAYLLLDGSHPLGVFTGGSLIVGAAARTDLVDPARTRELAHAQYASLQRLAALPDHTAVWPTHGAGSFCSSPPGADRTSSIGHEKATNALLTAPDADTFADRLIDSLGGYPAYFGRLPELNRTGPAVLPAEPALPVLDAATVRAARQDGAVVLDVRPVTGFADGHIPGSVSISLRPAFASWLGWIFDPDSLLIVVRDPGQDPAEILAQAYKIGYERFLGELRLDAWLAADGGLARLPLLHPAQIGDRPVLDVRQDSEFAGGHLPGARHVELGDLPAQVADVGDGYTVMCGHGERATTAASLLLRDGRSRTAVMVGGPEDWAAAIGRRLEP